MMLEHPARPDPDDNDTILATSPDFSELTTFGETEDDATARAIDAFDEAIAPRISGHGDMGTVVRPGEGLTMCEHEGV